MNLSIISSTENFLLRQGIAIDSLALFQQEDSNIVNSSDICSSGAGSDTISGHPKQNDVNEAGTERTKITIHNEAYESRIK